ncbi:MAG TPA: ABC transporter permease [Methanobacterium sp.]|nr:ABC transporter permease [Methanobacterium sp.]
MSRISTDIKYSLKETFRDRMNIFWMFVFPIVLFLLFGYIFGGQSGSITLYYQDNDGSQMSNSFIQALNSTGALELKDGSGMNLEQMLKDGKVSAYLEIPKGFGKDIVTTGSGGFPSADLPIYYDKSKSTSMAAISVVQQVANGFNMKMSGAKNIINVNPTEAASSGMNYFDFLLPGILAITIMSAATNMAVGTVARLRSTGVFRKLSTTPLSSKEWIAARITTWTVLVILSLAVAVFLAWLVFDIHPNINLISLLLIVLGTALFAGFGIVVANFVKNEESAMNAVGVITFPLMFVSGTLIPVENMPWFLQYLAKVSPLTYLSEGLRSSMITGNTGDAAINLAIVAVLGIILFGLGAATFSWKED